MTGRLQELLFYSDLMATTDLFCEEDLLCPLCSKIFNLPVLLKCSHNSCRACLHKQWEWKGSRECPVCGIVSISERPPINLELKIAADLFQEQRTSKNELCSQHKEKLNLFCQTDEEPICLVCFTSKQHKIHKFCPIEEAAQEKKAQISAKLQVLQKQLKILSTTMEHWEETQNYIKTQANQNEKEIKEEFMKLHQFLWMEEKVRLMTLREEEEMKTQLMCEKLKNIQDQITNLTSIIRDIEATTAGGDLAFLQDYKQTKKRAKFSFQEPECIRDILIDSAKHLGLLKFGVWKKMAKIIRYVPITLDPNTAQPNLRFSEELASVQYGSKQLLPDNPERCNSRVCVLGATGFTSGKHSWTVEVGSGKNWYIGVAQESIKRKTVVFLKPTEGFWAIGLCNGDAYWAQTCPRTRLAVKKKPERIAIELDYDKGKVVFINTADLTTIHTFKDRFTEKLFPYFSPGMYEEGQTTPLAICPLPIAVDVQQDTQNS